MALYFGEYLTNSPIEEKLELASFLIKLQSNFPVWKGQISGILFQVVRGTEVTGSSRLGCGY